MGTQQFCLRWNNHQSNMLNVFDQLLRNEAFVDVTLACEGVSVKAHKMVLSACSPYFQNLFLENPCQHPIVILKDMKYSELRAIIDFMYKGEINVSQDQLSALLKTAETLKVKGLAEVSTGNVPNAGGEVGLGPSVLEDGGSGGPIPSSNANGAATTTTGSGSASVPPSSPTGDGRASPPTKRKRHRPGRRPSNGEASDTGDRGAESQFESEPLSRLKSEPIEPGSETPVEVVMEPPSQQYEPEVPTVDRNLLGSDSREREISLIPRADGIPSSSATTTTVGTSSGHTSQPQPSTSGTSQPAQGLRYENVLEEKNQLSIKYATPTAWKSKVTEEPLDKNLDEMVKRYNKDWQMYKRNVGNEIIIDDEEDYDIESDIDIEFEDPIDETMETTMENQPRSPLLVSDYSDDDEFDMSKMYEVDDDVGFDFNQAKTSERKQLLYTKNAPGICQLGNSNILVSEASLTNALKTSTTGSQLARKLLEIVFKKDALVTCSVRGLRGPYNRKRSNRRRPGLCSEGVNAIIEYVQQFSMKHNGKEITKTFVTKSLGTRLSELRESEKS